MVEDIGCKCGYWPDRTPVITVTSNYQFLSYNELSAVKSDNASCSSLHTCDAVVTADGHVAFFTCCKTENLHYIKFILNFLYYDSKYIWMHLDALSQKVELM